MDLTPTRQPVDNSRQGRSNRSRGARAERAVVAWLRANGFPDARRYLAGDGRQPGDIDAIPGVVIEVKDMTASAWPSWRSQAHAEAGPNRVAIVVRRERGVPDVAEWPAQISAPPVPDWFHAVECRRTGQTWFAAPFGAVIEAVTA